MRICQSNVNFLGIKPPYRINDTTIYPIEQDLSLKQIEEVKRCITDNRFIGQGLNGRVYRINDDYVVKVPISDRNVKDSILNETKKLDMLYDFLNERKVDLQNTQRGIASFFTDKGEEYLISTYVKGSERNKTNNRLNKYNIDSMMKILTELDIGSEKYGRIMSYDYNSGNVNFTKKSAGILDMEYMRGTPLNFDIDNHIIRGRWSLSPHLSDTSALVSNVRTFEFGNLYHYLMSLSQSKAEKIFKIYLDRKSLYHAKMAEFYTQKSTEGTYTEIFKDLARRENNHSNLLNKKHITPDIIKSEAIKIQLGEFLYRICGSKIRGNYNPYQIYNYYTDSQKYFKNKFKETRKSGDYELASYYYDCMRTLGTWKQLKDIVYNGYNESRFVYTAETTLDIQTHSNKKWFSNFLQHLHR